MQDQGMTLDVITPQQAGTLPALFEERCRRDPQGEAYRQFDAAWGRWRSYTWAQVHETAAQWRAALAREGLDPGERAAVMLRNCVEWVCALGIGKPHR